MLPCLVPGLEHIGLGANNVAFDVNWSGPDLYAALHYYRFMVGLADDDRRNGVPVQMRRLLGIPFVFGVRDRPAAARGLDLKIGGGRIMREVRMAGDHDGHPERGLAEYQ